MNPDPRLLDPGHMQLAGMAAAVQQGKGLPILNPQRQLLKLRSGYRRSGPPPHRGVSAALLEQLGGPNAR